MENRANGCGSLGLLTIVFIVLKLCKVIDWNWLWVLSPLWIGGVLALCVVIVICVVMIIMSIIDKYF